MPIVGQSASCPTKQDGRTQAQLGPCRSVLCCCPPAVKPGGLIAIYHGDMVGLLHEKPIYTWMILGGAPMT